MKLRMDLACPFLGFGCKLFGKNSCGEFNAVCVIIKKKKYDGISVWAMGVMGSLEFRVVDGFA